MHWFRSEFDVSVTKKKTSVRLKGLSPYPFFRIALDVVGHVPLVVQYSKVTRVRQGEWHSKGSLRAILVHMYSGGRNT